ncbi:hypothetical protein COO60DRAFT_159596 [Scenedesmus sp. NREL 46B-D3]|nr:hypothetical protein COO60DRAFT_159596 [Scenedesmus sp. NREL 46B-D3]
MDPLTAALSGLGTNNDQRLDEDREQLTATQLPLEKQPQPLQQQFGSIAQSNGSAAAAAISAGVFAGGNSRQPTTLVLRPLSSATEEDSIAAAEESDKLSPLSSPGAAAAEAAAADAAAGVAGGSGSGSANGSGDGSNNSSGSGSASRPIPVPTPPLADPDLNAEQLGQLLQKVGPCAAVHLLMCGLLPQQLLLLLCSQLSRVHKGMLRIPVAMRNTVRKCVTHRCLHHLIVEEPSLSIFCNVDCHPVRACCAAAVTAGKQASPAISDARFSMEEFLKNKSALATAARRELGGGGAPAADMDDDVGSCLEGSGHDAELARQAAHLSSILEGVGEEGKVNRELAGLLLERLESSRK